MGTLYLFFALFASTPSFAQEEAKSPSPAENMVVQSAAKHGVDPTLLSAMVSLAMENRGLPISSGVGPMKVPSERCPLQPEEAQLMDKTPAAAIDKAAQCLSSVFTASKPEGLLKAESASQLEESDAMQLAAYYAHGKAAADRKQMAKDPFILKLDAKYRELRAVKQQRDGEGGDKAAMEKAALKLAQPGKQVCKTCMKVNPEVMQSVEAMAAMYDGTPVNLQDAALSPSLEKMSGIKSLSSGTEAKAKGKKKQTTYEYGDSIRGTPMSNEKMAKLVPANSDKYDSYIVKYATAKGLDPKLIKAWVASESTFNPKATSSVGAKGLLQLMPDTARMMAKRRGEGKTFSEKNLTDPETSIKLGVEYISYLYEQAAKKFNNSSAPADMPAWITERVIASYNAGPSVMDNKKFSSGVREYVNKILSLKDSSFITITATAQ